GAYERTSFHGRSGYPGSRAGTKRSPPVKSAGDRGPAAVHPAYRWHHRLQFPARIRDDLGESEETLRWQAAAPGGQPSEVPVLTGSPPFLSMTRLVMKEGRGEVPYSFIPLV